MNQQLPKIETYYQWKQFDTVEGEKEPRLLTPWADPDQYEWPMDWMFETIKQAKEAKSEYAPYENWVLVKVVITPVEFVGSDGYEEENN